jgi:hypothetical protein
VEAIFVTKSQAQNIPHSINHRSKKIGRWASALKRSSLINVLFAGGGQSASDVTLFNKARAFSIS